MQQQGLSDLLLTLLLFFTMESNCYKCWTFWDWSSNKHNLIKYYRIIKSLRLERILKIIKSNHISLRFGGKVSLLIWILSDRQSCPRSIFFLIKMKIFLLHHKRCTTAGRPGKRQFTACQIDRNVLFKRSLDEFLEVIFKQLWCNFSLHSLNRKYKTPSIYRLRKQLKVFVCLWFLIMIIINHIDFVCNRHH